MSGETSEGQRVRKSARQPIPKVRFDELENPILHRNKQAILKKKVKNPDEPIQMDPDLNQLTVKQVIANMLKEQRAEAAAQLYEQSKRIVESTPQLIPKNEPLYEEAVMEDTTDKDPDFIRRVDPKIVIHTGLRHTFAGTTKYAVDYNTCAKIPPKLLPVRRLETPITSKTEIPTAGRRNPINSRMVRTEDVLSSFQRHTIVKKYETKLQPKEEVDMDASGIARHTFDKIGSATVYQHIMSLSNRASLLNQDQTNRGTASLGTRPVPGSNREVGLPQISLQDSTGIHDEDDTNGKMKRKTMNAERFAPYDKNGQKPSTEVYRGVIGAERIPSYGDDRLTTNNPSLASKLAQIFGYPDPVLATQVFDERVGLDELVARKAELDRQRALDEENASISEIVAKVRAAAPVERKTYTSATVEVPNMPGNHLDECPPSIQIVYNGGQAEIPGEIYCHLCHSAMRLCLRKSKYRGELREYPAYRCLRKGCQTFRSVRKIMRDEYAESHMNIPHASGTALVSYRSILGSDSILDSLMSMPECRVDDNLETTQVKQEEIEDSGYYGASTSKQHEVKKEVVEDEGPDYWNGPDKLDELINAHIEEQDDEPFVKPEPLDDYGSHNSNTVDDS